MSGVSGRPGDRSPAGTSRPRWWWALLAVCGLHGAYALAAGGAALLAVVGLVPDAGERALPAVFPVHALAGGVALVTGALQLDGRLLRRSRRLHRALGRAYVGAVAAASLAGLASALHVDVGAAARAAFVAAATLWFVTTAVAVREIRRRDVRRHREWMVRSVAVALFFVTLEPWVAALAWAGLSTAAAYPLGVLAGWGVNLAAAEVWVRRSRGRGPRPRPRRQRTPQRRTNGLASRPTPSISTSTR